MGFSPADGPIPVSSGVVHVQARHDTAVIHAEGVTITVRRMPNLTKRFELAVAAGHDHKTSYELDFT
ncbi:hypothetical protein ALI144C_35855 [Actinosynnema sp. ALI-1.44]|nr:hypothetical protein ALI144C_35855 [Actinosynnema sp. ALI-1.44]